MATSINHVVSSETSIGGSIYAPPKKPGTAADDTAPAAGTAPVRRVARPTQEVEIFLIAVSEPYRSTLSKLMAVLAPYQEQLAKAAFKKQKKEAKIYNPRPHRKPWSVPSFFGKGLLRALVR